MLGIDAYSMRARVAPAVLAASPAISLGIAGLPLLVGTNKLWSVIAFAFTTFAALAARKAGNRVQDSLYEAWGGMPTTSRLRFRDNGSAAEILRRHAYVERVLGGGLRLPTQVDEQADPASADHEYAAAMKRVIGKVRKHAVQPLLPVENRNYGYSRNLLGLKPLGVATALATLVISFAVAVAVSAPRDASDALPLAVPIVVSAVALILWRQVDASFVRPSADAYADRVIDVLDDLPTPHAE